MNYSAILIPFICLFVSLAFLFTTTYKKGWKLFNPTEKKKSKSEVSRVLVTSEKTPNKHTQKNATQNQHSSPSPTP